MRYTSDDAIRYARLVSHWYAPVVCEKAERAHSEPKIHYVAMSKHNEPFIVEWFYPGDGGNPGWLVLDREGFTMFNNRDLKLMSPIRERKGYEADKL